MIKIDDYLDLVKWVFFKKFKKYIKYKDDILQEGYLGLLKARDTFDESKGVVFTTYAVPLIKNQMLNYIIRERAYMKKRPTYSKNSKGDIVNNVELLEVLDNVVDDLQLDSYLKGTHSDYWKLYIQGYTMKEIGELYGVSKQAISYVMCKEKPIIEGRLRNNE